MEDVSNVPPKMKKLARALVIVMNKELRNRYLYIASAWLTYMIIERDIHTSHNASQHRNCEYI